MYFHAQASLSARLAALDHFHAASNILLDSTARLLDLYRQALDLPSIGRIAPELFVGHIRIAGQAHEDLVRLAEAQIHASGSLARLALEKTANMAPPEVELAIDAMESIIETGEAVAEGLGDASIKAVCEVEKRLGRAGAAKKAVRR